MNNDLIKEILAYIVLFLVACFAITLVISDVKAAEIELKLGTVKFSHHNDGIWYQKNAGPYTLNVTSPSGYLGITDNLGSIRWHAGFRYLGSYSTVCECLSSDRAYELGNPAKWPLSTFKTKGDVFGPQLTLSQDLGPFRLFGGAMLAGASNKVSVTNWYPSLDNPDTGLRWGDPQDLNVAPKRLWKLVPVIGVSYRYGATSFDISATKLNTNKGNTQPIVNGWATSAEVGYTF